MNDGSAPAIAAEPAQAVRGKLKIFLGAAPGVGKTFEMLTAARRKKAEGIDVVVGALNTRRRRETEALLAGLESIAPRRVTHKEQSVDELDLDALIARAPQLAIVDELAHTNAPGSRHPRRHQDIDELVAAGIDVYTTLNIQHVESLNDVVAQITQVRVRETVPDSVLDAAEVEVVDLTPDDLMQRLREGKVYPGEGGERALANYFTPSNLTALRELALRRTAENVDERLREHRRRRGVSEIWAAGDRVLVGVNEMPGSVSLVRYARRVADHFAAPWLAVHLETSRDARLSQAELDRIGETLRLAESLGAETLSIPASGSIAEELLRIAREHNVTQIILGQSRRSRWYELFYGSVVRELTNRAGNITVQLMAQEDAPAESALTLSRWEWSVAAAHIRAGLLVGSMMAIAFALERFANMPIFALLWLSTALIFAAARAVQSRLLARAATRRAERAAGLLMFSRRLTALRKIGDVLKAATQYALDTLKVETAILTPDGDGLRLRAIEPEGAKVEGADLVAAKWCFEQGLPAGHGTDTLPEASRLFLPVRGGGATLGVLGVRREGPALAPHERRLLDALADLAAIALERIRLAKDKDQAKLAAEAEKLRGSLLDAISNALRSPLAVVHEAIATLRSQGRLRRAVTREDMLDEALDETERMTRFLDNLVLITRIDAGTLLTQPQAVSLRSIVESAVRRSEKILAGREVRISLPADLPSVSVDPELLEQALIHLLDNAAKFSGEGSPIEIGGAQHRFAITLSVRDEGPGIPPAELPKVFDFLYRVRVAGQQHAGIGLGLAVARGLVQAIGGRISAHNRRDRIGAEFEIEFPASLAEGHSAR
ncbi:MAG TPA: sensor histidine kinase KdpD [Nevskiaceae bacterium]|nr:sensor histidine kinase KdpD [Nevskiaceae bacterium]